MDTTVVSVCLIVLTAAGITMCIIVGIALQDVRRIRVALLASLEKLDRDLSPLITELTHIAEDVRETTFTARCQVEKIETTADFVSKSLQDIIERWITTFTVVNSTLAEPIENFAFFLKGFSRGIKYFFGNGKGVGHTR